jgi:hypothetical protein
MGRLSPPEERIKELEHALARERQVSAAERRRADSWQEAAQRAYRFVAGGRPLREAPAKSEG